MSKAACVAVTGATGYLGQFVCQDLLARGYQVRGLARQQPLFNISGVQWHIGDITSAAMATELLADTQHLVHCAFAHLPGRYRGGEGNAPDAFWNDNFLSTRRLLDTAVAQQLLSCVLISSRAVFDGYPAGAELDDQLAPKPTTLYGTLKAAEEALAHQYNATTPLQVRCLRSSGIFGLIQPLARSKWWALVEQAMHSGVDFSNQGVTETHGADVAAAIHALLKIQQDHTCTSYNCSDVVVSQQMLAACIRNPALSLQNTNAPMAPSGPVLNSSRLHNLGWAPTGLAHAQAVITALVQARKLDSNNG